MKNSILLTTTIFLTSSYGINAQKPFNQQLREAAKTGNLTEVKKILEKPKSLPTFNSFIPCLLIYLLKEFDILPMYIGNSS